MKLFELHQSNQNLLNKECYIKFAAEEHIPPATVSFQGYQSAVFREIKEGAWLRNASGLF
jgi:hypothetical protein